MDILKLIDTIFESNTVVDENGNERSLSANVDQMEGEFIKKIIEENNPARSIEVGCANGIASLFICAGLKSVTSAHHTIIDPNQKSEWANTGLSNLRRANVDYFTLLEKPSEIALPELYAKGERYDFGFIDGWHTFDHTLMDFFFIDKMLNLNGIIVIDDISFPSINKVMRYILMNYPSYIQIGQVEAEYSIKKRKFRSSFRSFFKLPFKLVIKLLPQSLRYRIFASNLIKDNKELKLNSSMVALRKVKPDTRSWDWYKEF